MISKKITLVLVISLLSFYISTFMPKSASASVCCSLGKENPSRSGTVHIGNNVLNVSIQDSLDSSGVGTFTIRTDAGHPNPGQDVFYGGANENPWSTFTTIRVEDTYKEYVTSIEEKTASPGYTVEYLDNFSPLVTKISDTRATVSWTTSEHLLITLLIDIRGTTVADTIIEVTVTIKNQDTIAHSVAVRYEWDLMIEVADNSWIRVWTNPSTPQSWTNNETDWVSPNFQFWETVNNPDTPAFSIYGSTVLPNVNPPPTLPDRLVYASWASSYGTAYDYTPVNESGMDSAVLYYWNPVSISPSAQISRTAYVTTVVQAQLMAFAWATDATGNSKSIFQLSDNVYVRGQNFPMSTPVAIYLIPDGKQALPSNAVANASATTDSSKNLPNTLVWHPPLYIGQFDIWVDVNKNGVFDAGDVWNNQAVGIYQFSVIPEYWIGIIPSLLACSTAAVFASRRVSRRKFR